MVVSFAGGWLLTNWSSASDLVGNLFDRQQVSPEDQRAEVLAVDCEHVNFAWRTGQMAFDEEEFRAATHRSDVEQEYVNGFPLSSFSDPGNRPDPQVSIRAFREVLARSWPWVQDEELRVIMQSVATNDQRATANLRRMGSLCPEPR